MKINVISVDNQTKTAKNGKSYQTLEVVFKNLSFGNKVESKQLMSFGATKDAFDFLRSVSGGNFEVTVVKNDRGYNDWTAVQPITDAEASVQDAPSNATKHSSPARSNFETPEERAARQVLIVRQSCLSNAVAILNAGAKTPPNPDDVMILANRLVDFILQPPEKVMPKEGAEALVEMDDDIPY